MSHHPLSQWFTSAKTMFLNLFCSVSIVDYLDKKKFAREVIINFLFMNCVDRTVKCWTLSLFASFRWVIEKMSTSPNEPLKGAEHERAAARKIASRRLSKKQKKKNGEEFALCLSGLFSSRGWRIAHAVCSVINRWNCLAGTTLSVSLRMVGAYLHHDYI